MKTLKGVFDLYRIHNNVVTDKSFIHPYTLNHEI